MVALNPNSRLTGSRLRVVAFTIACLTIHLSTVAHQALVQHVTCAEHGEAVHLRAAGGDSLAALNVADVSHAARDPHAGASGVPATEADEHGHCSAAGLRNSLLRSKLDVVVGYVPISAAVEARPEIAPPAIIPPYLMAPKTSPPGRA